VRQHKSLVVLIISISLATPAIAQLGKCTIRELPKGIAEIISTKYAGWRPEQVSDLRSDDLERWTKAHSNLCPGVTSGHFESAVQVSYAVLLLNKEPGYKFLLFDKDRSGNFRSILLDQAEGKNAGQPVISRVLPGEYSDPETGKSVKTKLDSVLVEWIEAAAQLYYWSGSKYHKLQVQD